MVIRAVLFGTLAAVALAAAPPAAAQPAPPEPERWEWTGSVAPGKTLRVENPHGDVRARFGGYEGKVEVHAVLQNLHPGAAPLRVFAEPGPSGLLVRVGRGEGGAPDPGKGPADRVDLVVRVPQGARLSVVTDAGAIEVKGLRSDVSAQSGSGAISVREVEGLITTLNRYGATEVVLEPPPPGSEQTFESLTGDLSLTLPARADATVVAETSAWITTDISLDIVRRPREEPSKRATGTVGNGGARIALRTKRGSVQIFQMEDFRERPAAPADTPPAPPE